MYYFKNECEGFIRFPNARKHSHTNPTKTYDTKDQDKQCLYLEFSNLQSISFVWKLMKPEARVFEITSLTKKISFNYHFNEFF